MDIIDHASETEDRILRMRIQAQSSQAKERQLKPRHRCYNCDEPFAQGDLRLFCDTDCRDDYEKFGRAA